MAKYPDVTAGQTESCINRLGGWDNFLRFIGGSGKVVFDSILTLLREVKLDAQSAVTTSEEYFEEAGVKWADENVKAQFIGLDIPDTPASDFCVRKLEHSSPDAPIVAELGGEEKAETSVAHFKDFLSKNRKSTEWFIFYLRGRGGKLWAVYALRNLRRADWDVGGHSVTSPFDWLAVDRVVSRKSA
jgi:hypothetical protein